MSIFFDFKVNPGSVRFRRAVQDDVSDIESFVTELDKSMFYESDIGRFIELSTLAICMINDKNQVSGFIALNDYPNVPGVDPAAWEFWIRNSYKRYYLPRNTLFIHFMCCREQCQFFLEDALKSIFLNDSYLLHIVLVAPPKSPQEFFDKYDTFKKKNFYRYFSDNCSPYLCTALRREFCPSYKIRRAVEEDNDDLVKILDKKCSRLKDLYGEFYVSEIVGQRPKTNHKILVAEYQEQAVGLMCLNTDLDYEKLQNEYDLTPFYGLRKATAAEKEKRKRNNSLYATFAEPIMRGQWSPFRKPKECCKEKVKKKLVQISKQDLTSSKSQTKINFMQHDTSYEIEPDANFLPHVKDSKAILAEELLDADPFEYEIVNIDESLMKVSTVLSSIILNERNISNNSELPCRDISMNLTTKSSSTKKGKKTKKFTNLDGEPNAIVIELLALRDDIDERKDFDLLESCFEIFPNHEYCIIRKPCSETSFSLLQHFCYVPARKNVETNYALYVAHRGSVRGKLRVRQAELVDIPQIAQLMISLDAREVIWNLKNTVIDNVEHQVYVFLTGHTVIGFGLLDYSDYIEYIKRKYNMDSFINLKYYEEEDNEAIGIIKNTIIHPTFEVHFRFFAREMMRLSGNNALIWMTNLRSKLVIQKINSLVSYMAPLTPRLSELDCVPKIGIQTLFTEEDPPFSTWLLSKKMTSIPKMTVDTKLLIVGASSTALGFLNELLFSDASLYLTFTNITLISANGLPYTRKRNKLSELMLKRHRTRTDRFLKSTPYGFYINLINGTIVKINQKNKNITVKSGCKCNYDLLFLLIGKQYQYPDYGTIMKKMENSVMNSNEKPYVRLDVPKNNIISDEQVICCGYPPANVFVINHVRDATKALKYIKDLLTITLDGKIIVYGDSIEAYCCLATLLENNVPGNRIVFLEPFPPANRFKSRISVFANEHVDTIINDILNNKKVTKYEGYFDSWVLNTNNIVTQVQFVCYHKTIKINCGVLFYYGTKGIDLNSFKAINASNMAYNGGIIINYNYKTRDKSVYAAGPVTRYSNKYRAEIWRHKYYDTNEIGRHLGSLIRNEMDPLFRSQKNDEHSFNYEDKSNNLPNLTQPVIVHCILPGKLQYLDVRSPGKKIPHQYVQSNTYNGYVIQTFKGGYFKLHFNRDLIVDAITCLTSDLTSLDNFKNLYGHSAISLNNVLIRFRLKLFDNLFSFFQSPWAYHFYHDHGTELLKMAQELLPQNEPKGKSIKDCLQEIASHESVTSINCSKKIREIFVKSPYVESITKFVIQWLSENEYTMLKSKIPRFEVS